MGYHVPFGNLQEFLPMKEYQQPVLKKEEHISSHRKKFTGKEVERIRFSEVSRKRSHPAIRLRYVDFKEKSEKSQKSPKRRKKATHSDEEE